MRDAAETGGGRVKITRITTQAVNAEMRNWVFVRVETDQPGLYGWGECTLEWKTQAVMGAVADLAPLLIGTDPRDIEQAVRRMDKHGFRRMGVIGTSAISAIEVALWNIPGKERGVPEAPGLSVEVDAAEAARHPYAPEVQHATNAMLPDGTIVDW